MVGYAGGKVWEDKFYVIKGREPQEGSDGAAADAVINDSDAAARPSALRSVHVVGTWLTLWLVPLAVLAAVLGTSSIYLTEGIFFSKVAVVTFGGAYAVLAYIAQQAVNAYGWLQPGEMLDGLGMAETTPGPLIQVVQFVGFMAAFRNPGALDPMVAGVLASILVTWVTFIPCFLYIFLGAPYIEYLRGNKALSTALSGITAAVVGVVLNLAVWFALHVAFGSVDETHTAGIRLLAPQWATANPASIAIGAAAFLAMFRFKIGMIPTLLTSAGIGLAYHTIFLG